MAKTETRRVRDCLYASSANWVKLTWDREVHCLKGYKLGRTGLYGGMPADCVDAGESRAVCQKCPDFEPVEKELP